MPHKKIYAIKPVFNLKQLAQAILALPEDEQEMPAEIIINDDRHYSVSLTQGKGSEAQTVITAERPLYMSEEELIRWQLQDEVKYSYFITTAK